MTRTPRSAYDAARFVLNKLREAGHTALLAGGCVRDMLLKREPKDYDVATDAVPERVKALFPGANQVGAKFGVMLVHKYGHDIEVATFRSDGDYSDGRHPDQVHFGTDREDALRRDFTINGLFFDPTTETVIDYVDGQADLDAGVVRTIGDPMQRFAEDHLRLLRAVRFAARLSFEIEPGTSTAIAAAAPKLLSISPERIWMELSQILAAPSRAVGWDLIHRLNLAQHLVGGWKPDVSRHDVVVGRLAALGDTPVPSYLGVAAIMTDEASGGLAQVAKVLRLSNREANALGWLCRKLPLVQNPGTLELADLKQLMANEHWPSLLLLLRADLIASGGDLADYDQLVARAGAIPPDAVAPPPFVTGDDLQALGLRPGPDMGGILNELYRAQLDERITTRLVALEFAKILIDRLENR